MKKGFTLAEILVVLMVIGVVAALTIPSMIANIKDTQYKVAYKKAYKMISQAIEQKYIEKGHILNKDSVIDALELLKILDENLSVKGYASNMLNNKDNSDEIHYFSAIKARDDLFIGTCDNENYCITLAPGSEGYPSSYIIAEDNIAYTIQFEDTNLTSKSYSKLTINSQQTEFRNI